MAFLLILGGVPEILTTLSRINLVQKILFKNDIMRKTYKAAMRALDVEKTENSTHLRVSDKATVYKNVAKSHPNTVYAILYTSEAQ